jgi:hypothetical protein
MGEHKLLDSSQLYQLLPRLGMSLSVYLVYAHLRGQEYRVLRHAPKRYPLLVQQERKRKREEQQRESEIKGRPSEPVTHTEPPHSAASSCNSPPTIVGGYPNGTSSQRRTTTMTDDANTSAATRSMNENTHSTRFSNHNQHHLHHHQTLSMKQRVRESIQSAPIPTIILDPGNGLTTTPASTSPSIDINPLLTRTLPRVLLAFDVYEPNSQFAKTHPGLPDFSVAVSHYNVPCVQFETLQELVRGGGDGRRSGNTAPHHSGSLGKKQGEGSNCETHPTSRSVSDGKSSGDDYDSDFDAVRIVPVKLATVSDSGTVIMFGLSPRGVPTLKKALTDIYDE